MTVGENLVKNLSCFLDNLTKQYLTINYKVTFLEVYQIYDLCEYLKSATKTYADGSISYTDALKETLLAIPGLTDILQECQYGLLTNINTKKEVNGNLIMDIKKVRMFDKEQYIAIILIDMLRDVKDKDLLTYWMAYHTLSYNRCNKISNDKIKGGL